VGAAAAAAAGLRVLTSAVNAMVGIVAIGRDLPSKFVDDSSNKPRWAVAAAAAAAVAVAVAVAAALLPPPRPLHKFSYCVTVPFFLHQIHCQCAYC